MSKNTSKQEDCFQLNIQLWYLPDSGKELQNVLFTGKISMLQLEDSQTLSYKILPS